MPSYASSASFITAISLFTSTTLALPQALSQIVSINSPSPILSTLPSSIQSAQLSSSAAAPAISSRPASSLLASASPLASSTLLSSALLPSSALASSALLSSALRLSSTINIPSASISRNALSSIALSIAQSATPSIPISSTRPISSTHSPISLSIPVSGQPMPSEIPDPVVNLVPAQAKPWFACPKSSAANFCLGESGLTPIIVVCTQGIPSTPIDCRSRSGDEARCYATSPTAGNAHCADAPANAPPLQIPTYFNGTSPAGDRRPASMQSSAAASASSVAGALSMPSGTATLTDAQLAADGQVAPAAVVPASELPPPPTAPEQAPDAAAAGTYAPPMGTGSPRMIINNYESGGRPMPTGTGESADGSSQGGNGTATTLGSTWAPQPTQPTSPEASTPSSGTFVAGSAAAKSGAAAVTAAGGVSRVVGVVGFAMLVVVAIAF